MDHFIYKNGLLHAENVALDVLAERFGTPFYCYSHATLLRHYRVFSEALASLDPLICFAVKANGALAVLASLARAGSGADVVSGGEIRLALAAGIAPEKIVFSGVGKTPPEMEYALAQNIFQFNVESEPELLALSQAAVAAGKTAMIAFRVNPDVAPDTHAKISTGQKESKFGVPMRRALELYRWATTLPGIAVQGVSVHIGSQLTDLAPFSKAFARVRSLVESLRAEGHAIQTLDLGGGLGVPYGDAEAPPAPASYAAMVKKAVEGMGCKLIFEPGRLLVGNAGILVSRVIYVKKSEGKSFVIVDAGMNDLMRPALYDAYHAIVPVAKRDRGIETVDIVGPVCETGDIFARDRVIPAVEAGDLVAFRTAGAYGAAMACTYNARPLPAEIMVKGADSSLIRTRQTIEELMMRDRLPDWLK